MIGDGLKWHENKWVFDRLGWVEFVYLGNIIPTCCIHRYFLYSTFMCPINTPCFNIIIRTCQERCQSKLSQVSVTQCYASVTKLDYRFYATKKKPPFSLYFCILLKGKKRTFCGIFWPLLDRYYIFDKNILTTNCPRRHITQSFPRIMMISLNYLHSSKPFDIRRYRLTLHP